MFFLIVYLLLKILWIKPKYKTHVIDKSWHKYYYLSCVNFQFFSPSNFLPHAIPLFILIRSNPFPPVPQGKYYISLPSAHSKLANMLPQLW